MEGMADAVSYMMGAQQNSGNKHEGFGGFGLMIVVFLLLFGGFGSGFGGKNGVAAAATNNAEFDSLLAGQNQIKSQMSYENISTNLNGLGKGLCETNYALNNTITGGFSNVQSVLCQGFAGVNTAFQNSIWGLSEKLNIQASQQNLQLQAMQNAQQNCCCELKSAIAASTQAILAKMCTSENQDLRDKLFESSQREQTTNIISQLVSQLGK